MGRKSVRRAKRIHIAKACKEILAREGMGGTTLEKVAIEAQVSTSLIHHHFLDKEDLYLEVITLLFRELPRFEDPENMDLSSLIQALLQRPKKQRRTQVRAWMGLMSESVRNPAIQSLLKKNVRKNLDFLEGMLTFEGHSQKEARQYSAGVVAFIFGALFFDTLFPAYSPGFAAPFLQGLFEKK